MEVTAIVQARERVEVGELPGLAEASRVLDRRPSPERQLLELAHLLVTEGRCARAREDGQEADRLAVARYRHGKTGMDQVLRG